MPIIFFSIKTTPFLCVLMYTKRGKVLVLLLHFFNFLKVIQAGWGKPSLGSIFISDIKFSL